MFYEDAWPLIRSGTYKAPFPNKAGLLSEEQHAKLVKAAKKVGMDDSSERFKEMVSQLGKG